METIHADMTVSVTELKRNFAGILASAQGNPVAVLNHNKPEAYLIPARHYEQLLSRLEDAEDRKLVLERSDGPFVEVSLKLQPFGKRFPPFTSAIERIRHQHQLSGKSKRLESSKLFTLLHIIS